MHFHRPYQTRIFTAQRLMATLYWRSLCLLIPADSEDLSIWMQVKWIKMMKETIATNGGKYSTARMLVDYTNQLYMPLCNLTKKANWSNSWPARTGLNYEAKFLPLCFIRILRSGRQTNNGQLQRQLQVFHGNTSQCPIELVVPFRLIVGRLLLFEKNQRRVIWWTRFYG